MGILDRLNRIVRSEINDRRSSSRQDSQTIADIKASQRDARRQLALMDRQGRDLAQAVRDARDRADQWEERAVMALQNGEDDLAREAVIVRNQAHEDAARLRQELEEHRIYQRDVASAVEALEVKLEGIRASRRNTSSGQRRDASAWEQEFRKRRGQRRPSAGTPDTPSTGRRRDRPNVGDVFDTDGYFDEMDRMASKIDADAAQAEAMRELSGDDWTDPKRHDLNERFKRLERRQSRRDLEQDITESDDLADLKKRFES